MEATLEDKYAKLKKLLEGYGSLLMAFSGGVDSTLLLAVGKEVLGNNVVAATVSSGIHPRDMLKNAAGIAELLEVEHITIPGNELGNESFVANPPERCYICKHERYREMVDIATREGIAEVAEGAQLDDIGEYRPGLEAASELGVRRPLAETGFTKLDVRELSRKLGLSNWNSPPCTCLATRIPYHRKITREKLAVVERGEEFLKGLGFSPVRLRYIDEKTARIEVNPSQIQKLVSDGIREKVIDKMKGLNFTYTTTDLAGYRSGAMDEELPAL